MYRDHFERATRLAAARRRLALPAPRRLHRRPRISEGTSSRTPWRLTVPALVATLAVVLGSSCRPGTDDEASDDEAVRSVRTTKVARGDLVDRVALVGELQGKEEVRVLAMVTDTVRRLPVREGDRVRAGEVLAIVAWEVTSEAVAQAEAGLEAATASRDALEREVSRIRPLVEAGSAPRSQLEGLEAQLQAARAQVRQAAAGAGQASVQQGRTVIRSPISGVVTGVMVQEGEIAAPSMPLMTVVRPDELKVVLRAPERHFLRIRKGMPATVSPLTDPGTRVEAEVNLKGPVVDRMTRTGLVEIFLDNSDGLLVPGSLVRVELELGRRPDVILVPADAILFTGETEMTRRAVAFVASNGVARRRDVLLGERQGDLLEIREGLSEGETLVTRGAHFLRDGARIRVDGTEKPELDGPPDPKDEPGLQREARGVRGGAGGIGEAQGSEATRASDGPPDPKETRR